MLLHHAGAINHDSGSTNVNVPLEFSNDQSINAAHTAQGERAALRGVLTNARTGTSSQTAAAAGSAAAAGAPC
jgi:hypothetical protein